MKTKLVFVLTCSEDKHYLEQALMSVWSVRYHNPDAHIVLFIDDKTDLLLLDKRDEILNYISEKIVVSFDDKLASMKYRSRFIKTSIRQRISGDFLYIDCDTITTRCLDEVDELNCDMGAVPDSHLKVDKFGQSLLQATKNNVIFFDINLNNEEYYFSSGVLYVKDTPNTHQLYQLWHNLWLAGTKRNIYIDQPSLAKANIESGHLISRIDDKYNCVMYIQPDFAKDAFILHFTAYRNPSWLFTERVYRILQNEGIPEWLQSYILNPVTSYIPFRYTIYKSNLKSIIGFASQIGRDAKTYSKWVDYSFSDMLVTNRWHMLAKRCFQNKHFILGGILCVLPAWIGIKMHLSSPPIVNICYE